jgi:hypothetical protein
MRHDVVTNGELGKRPKEAAVSRFRQLRAARFQIDPGAQRFSETAIAALGGPPGGMFPPYQLKHEPVLTKYESVPYESMPLM